MKASGWMRRGALVVLALAGVAGWLEARPGEAAVDRPSEAGHGATWFETPPADRWWRTLTLADYNTRVVFLGVTALGAAGGVVGTFLLLRRRSLLSDTVSHCTLPGIAAAFLVAEAAGASGRSLPVLVAGAAVTGTLGMMSVAALRSRSRVRDDAALAIVLSVFFGLGIALLVIVQQLPTGNAAGLTSYIYGKAAAMTGADARWILLSSLGVVSVAALLFKEFKLLSFDSAYATTQGWPVHVLDLVLMSLVVAVTVIGLQAVGLLLVVALLIIPAAAARFWSHRLDSTILVAALIGAASGFVGAGASALYSKLPAGAVIVLAAVFCFSVSLILGTQRGILVRWIEHRRMTTRVSRLHLLRALYEWSEASAASRSQSASSLLDQAVPLEALRQSNHWSPRRLGRLIQLGQRERLVTVEPEGSHAHLTAHGKLEARRVTRNHRLWETYLLRYADVAPQHIHHNADEIEHVIDPTIVNELEELLAGRGAPAVPADPEKPGRGGESRR